MRMRPFRPLLSLGRKGGYDVKMEIDFTQDTWKCDDALLKIFFFIPKKGVDADYWGSIRKFVVTCLSKQAAVAKNIDIKASEEAKFKSQIARDIVRLKDLSETLSSNSKASPLVWTRFAFTALRAGIPPSEYFFKMYSRWRFERMLIHGVETVIRTPINTLGNGNKQKFTICDQVFSGSTLDRFLLDKDLGDYIDNKTQWTLASVECPKIEKSLANADNKEKKNRDAVGTHKYDLIKGFVDESLSNRHFKLSQFKKNNRYLCTITRQKLIELILNNPDNKHFRKSILRKALPFFIRFPGSRD